MDVNNISTNINTLNTSAPLQLDRSAASSRIENKNDDSLSLVVNDYNKKRDSLSIDVQSLNEGIAVSKISQNALNKEIVSLNKVQTALENIKNDDSFVEDKNTIKTQTNEFLKDFNDVAHQTKFKNEKLLSVDMYDEKKEIEISTGNSNYSIEKPNTPEYSSQIFDAINLADLNNPEHLDLVINKVKEVSSKLEKVNENFSQLEEKLINNAKDTLDTQTNLFNEIKTNEGKHFGKESNDFSKTNVSANLGYLAGAQANIVQSQSVRLLS